MPFLALPPSPKLPDWTDVLPQFGLYELRYILFAGGAFGLCYLVLGRRISHRKIQPKPALWRNVRSEFLYSALTGVIASILLLFTRWLVNSGYTPMYFSWEDSWMNIGPWALAVEVIVLIVVHDTYFYWMHRLSHHPMLFRTVHAVHHRSHDPTPWAAYAFHPLEAFWEFGFVPLVVLAIPLHVYSLVVFSFYIIVLNVIGHLGFEFFPRGSTRHPVGKWFNTPTHHNLHHSKVDCNYGLFLNLWDRLMGTNHKNYHLVFDAVKNRPAYQKLPAVLAHDGRQAVRTGWVAQPGKTPHRAVLVQAAR